MKACYRRPIGQPEKITEKRNVYDTRRWGEKKAESGKGNVLLLGVKKSRSLKKQSQENIFSVGPPGGKKNRKRPIA